MKIILCTCNSYPRSCHMEADAQVTLKALCLLHNIFKGEKEGMADSWIKIVSIQISPCLTLITSIWPSIAAETLGTQLHQQDYQFSTENIIYA